MLGTIVNAVAIILGSILGLTFKGGIGDSYKETVMNAVGLAILLIGIIGAIKTQDLLLLIFSLVIGSLIGEFLNVEGKLDRFGDYIESKVSSKEGSISKGFVTASLLYCVGSMSIVGALESGLMGNHQTLFAKSVLDGIISIIFASTLGVGVLLSSISVFIYQGAITIAASLIKTLLTDSLILEVSAVGSVLIMALGINMLEIKKIKVGNMLPAIFIPFIYYLVRMLIVKIF